MRCATTTDPLCEFLARVRKCLGGILRYCHRIFSRNPLRSCLGPWTHTRALLSSPFFVSRPLNRTPLPLCAAVDEIWPAGWHRGRIRIVLRLVRGSNSRYRCAFRFVRKNLNYPGIIFFFSPRNFSRFIVGKLEWNWTRFLVNFYQSLSTIRDGGGDPFFAISYLQCPYIVWSEAQTPLPV